MIQVLSRNHTPLKENAMGFSSLEITIFCIAAVSFIFSIILWFAKAESKIVPRDQKQQKDDDEGPFD